MNSTPAASSARRTARSLAVVIDVSWSAASARLIVARPNAASRARSSALQRSRASAQRAGVRHPLTEDFQDGFALQDVTFINPFRRANDRLIEKVFARS